MRARDGSHFLWDKLTTSGCAWGQPGEGRADPVLVEVGTGSLRGERMRGARSFVRGELVGGGQILFYFIFSV